MSALKDFSNKSLEIFDIRHKRSSKIIPRENFEIFFKFVINNFPDEYSLTGRRPDSFC